MRTGTSTNNVALREQDLYSKPMNTNIHYCLFGLFETKPRHPLNLAISSQTVSQKPDIDDHQRGNSKTAGYGHRGGESYEICAKIEGEQ
jgi:hypothetical protein